LHFIDYNCINILITKIYVISISSPDTIRAIKYNNNTCYLRAVYKPIVLRRDSSVSIKRVTSPGTGSRSSVYMRETVPFFRETDYSAVKRTIPRWDVDKIPVIGWKNCGLTKMFNQNTIPNNKGLTTGATNTNGKGKLLIILHIGSHKGFWMGAYKVLCQKKNSSDQWRVIHVCKCHGPSARGAVGGPLLINVPQKKKK